MERRTKRCRVCQQDLPITAFGKHKKSSDGRRNTCKRCRGAVESRDRSIPARSAVDLLFPVEPPLPLDKPYYVMAAVSQYLRDAHDNSAVALSIAEDGATLRVRMYGSSRPLWFTDSSSEWAPLAVEAAGGLIGATLRVENSFHTLGTPVVEPLRECMVLRGSILRKHGKKTALDTIRRRLLVGGILCDIEQAGEPSIVRTGSFDNSHARAIRTPIIVRVDTMQMGLQVQAVPFAPGGRYGGGVLVPATLQEFRRVDASGLLTTGEACKRLGIAEHTLDRLLQGFFYQRIYNGQRRYLDDVVLERVREKARFIRARSAIPQAGKRWTEEEQRVVWDAIMGRTTLKEAADRLGRSYCAVKMQKICAMREARGANVVAVS